MIIGQATIILSALNIVLTSFLAVYLSFVKHSFDKQMKKFTLIVAELSSLNRKTHDRLVESEELLKQNSNITPKIKKRLSYNASRLFKYDHTLKKDILKFIDGWENKTLNVKELILLSEKIKGKVDKLILELN